MSLSKKMNVISDESREELYLSNVSQNRQSFSDRICDDLCEEILQYLSLEDKLKLEGVSKQFQRTVLKKQYELTIKTMQYRKVTDKDKHLLIENMFIDLESFEKLLKKCPNIRSFELKEPEEECDYNEVFRLITKYCNNLREIDFGENEINDENIEEFQRKFGQQIKSLDYLNEAIGYNLFPNIERLKFDDYNDLEEVIPRLKLNKLKKIELSLKKRQENLVKTCVDTFPTLTHLYLDFKTENEKTFYKSLEFSSNLKHLIDFRFDSGFAENTELFCDSLKRMANKCQKLKSFECNLVITENLDIKQLLSSLEAFPALKRLNLCVSGDFFNENISKNIFSFEAFKGLSNITHLTLYINYYLFNETIFKDIDINLPNIQYLEFKASLNPSPEEVTQMADILSRLSRLQTLKLVFRKGINYNEIEVKIREKCRKIRLIDIKHYNYEFQHEFD